MTQIVTFYELGQISNALYVSTNANNTTLISTTYGNSSVNATINSTSFSGIANNTNFVGTISAANVVSNATLQDNLTNYATTASLSAYQTTAGLAANVATLTANNTNFVGTISAANVVSNAALQSNLANYQTTAGLAANVATLTANNTNFVGTISAANVVSNATLQANLTNYATTSSLSAYQTTAGLAANVATLTANNTSYFGGNLPAYYTNATNINTGTLPYAQLGANVVNTSANFTITGIQTHTSNIVYSNTSGNVVIGYNITDSSLSEFALNSNNFAEVAIWNANVGVAASADFIVNDTLGPAPTSNNYIDFGINGNGFSQASWTINGPSDGYLYTGNTNLSVGTAAPAYLNFFTGGTLAANERMRITAGGNVGINNTAPNATLFVQGTANVTGNTAIGSNLIVSGNLTINATSQTITNLNGVIYKGWDSGAVVPSATIVLMPSAPFGFNISNLVTQCTTSTFTVAIQINGTAVTGINGVTSNSLLQTFSSTGAYTVTAGQQVTAVVVASGSPTNAFLQLNVVRT
jgi:hypothetical protein